MKNVTRSELIERMMDLSGETKASTELSLWAFIECVQRAVADGEKVTLVGFGVFEPRQKKAREAREGRNPMTSQIIQIAATPESATPRFRPGLKFRQIVQEGSCSNKGLVGDKEP